MKKQLTTSNTPIPAPEIAALMSDAQTFVGGMKAEAKIAAHNLAKPDNAAPFDKTMADTLEQLKVDLARIRRNRDELGRELKASTLREQSLKDEIVRMTARHSDDRATAQNDLEKYRIQLSAFREAFDTSGTTDERLAKLQHQLLNMQALVESSAAERDLYRGRRPMPSRHFFFLRRPSQPSTNRSNT
jgi:tryptophan 2,3-dioxygenase